MLGNFRTGSPSVFNVNGNPLRSEASRVVMVVTLLLFSTSNSWVLRAQRAVCPLWSWLPWYIRHGIGYHPMRRFSSTKWANSQGPRIKAQALSESNDGSEPPIFKILFKKNPEINMCYTPKLDLPMSSSGALPMSTSPCCILLVDLSTRFPDSSHFCLYNISFNRIICLGT